jgi:hypothetical protein
MPLAASVAEYWVSLPAWIAAARSLSMSPVLACVAARDRAHLLVEVGGGILTAYAEPAGQAQAHPGGGGGDVVELAGVRLVELAAEGLGLDPACRNLRW